MEHLWSPWRSQYINSFSTKPEKPSCFLCDATAQNPDEQSTELVVYRATWCFVIMNRFPYNAGHLMVVPNEHVGDFSALKPEVATEIMMVLQLCHKALTQMFNPHGFNIGANLGRVAGAGVPDHVHMHILPRWNGDTNFMPLLAETKVVSESMTDTAAQLREIFHSITA
ncbi:MAG: HIT family protein [Candidatus Kapaibacterium sp.]|jgi:ATP adenylyltransferase